MHEWEEVQNDKDKTTERLEVPGGWIYVITEMGSSSFEYLHQNAVFVPDRGEG